LTVPELLGRDVIVPGERCVRLVALLPLTLLMFPLGALLLVLLAFSAFLLLPFSFVIVSHRPTPSGQHGISQLEGQL
jgi:hypothetical protein